MAFEELTDIKLDDSWKITQSASGDAPITNGIECFVQDVKLEAITQEGEIFYDAAYGWSLLDFIQMLDDELVIVEIKERVKSKLKNREMINGNSIEIQTEFEKDILRLKVSFKILSNDELITLNISVSRVGVEVT